MKILVVAGYWKDIIKLKFTEIDINLFESEIAGAFTATFTFEFT